MSEKLDEFVQRALDKLPPEPEYEPYSQQQIEQMAQFIIAAVASGRVKI